MGIETVIALAAAGMSAYNTQKTAKKQDQQGAASIRNQAKLQQQADQRVGEEVTKLESSRSDDERASRLEQYMTALKGKKSQLISGLAAPMVGGDAFKADSQRAAGEVQDYANKSAGLMSRIDAPGMQRQGEAFGYGRLGTDLALTARESDGQRFIDELRMNQIRRNPWLDAGAQLLGGMAGGMGQGGMMGVGGGQVLPGLAPVPGAPVWGQLGLGGGRGVRAAGGGG